MLTVKNSILRSLKVIAASLLFVWLAWTFLIPGDDGNKVIAWGCFLFFSATLIKGIVNLFDRRAKILIDANGIYFPGRKKRIIDWSEIKEFEIERNEYQDIVWIELKRGEPLHLKMFYLDIHPEVLHKHVESCMRRAAGLPDREELRKNAGKKGLAEFVEPGESGKNAALGAALPSSAAVDSDNAEQAFVGDNEGNDGEEGCAENASSDESAGPDNLGRNNDEEADESENSISGSAEPDPEEAENPDDNYLTSKHLLPPWFSDEPVTNDMIWTSVLTGGGVAMLFGLAYLEGDPPKISLAEQIIVVIAFTVLAPFFMFIHSFLRGSDTHREWAGLDTKKSVSYSVKAKKRVAAPKPQKTGESPRKVRSKKKRR